jgi:hypothetical protein
MLQEEAARFGASCRTPADPAAARGPRFISYLLHADASGYRYRPFARYTVLAQFCIILMPRRGAIRHHHATLQAFRSS